MKQENIKYILIHCSATREGVDVHASDIERWHREQGWTEIGYNYVVTLDGKVEMGRPLTKSGSHCNNKAPDGKTYNTQSIGICYVGGLDKDGNPKDTRTEAQKESLSQLIYNLKNTYPIVDVMGHRDTFPDINGDGIIDSRDWKKECPCFDVREDYPIAVCVAKKIVK